MQVKKKVLRIVLVISLAPYLFLVGYSLYYAIFGYDLYTMILPEYIRTIYGWEAFSHVFIWTGIVLCFIPVLPICLLYQIIYLFVYLIKRQKVNRVKETKKGEVL